MPIKQFGIYLAYAPTIKLEHQGLGRYLTNFLKAATRRTDIRVVIACPSWMREPLLAMCESEGVSINKFDIISPSDKPLLLRAHERYVQRKEAGYWLSRIARWKAKAIAALERHRLSIERQFATSRSFSRLLLLALQTVALGVLLLPLALVIFARKLAVRSWRALTTRLRRSADMEQILQRTKSAINEPKNEAFVVRLYRFMEQHETDLLVEMINRLTSVDAWYSPTAFWPSFNQIKAPRVMCVPDVVLRDFPIGFSRVGGDRFLENFQMVETAIEGCNHFITYSNDVKWNTLVDRYGVLAGNVSVVQHAVNDLCNLVTVRGSSDEPTTSRLYAEALFRMALNKATNPAYANSFANASAKFIFYPSQFRPSKNVVNLLRAYSYLSKERFLGHKLILTGNPSDMPEIDAFIREYNLANDALCLHGLTTPELAACYRLADLAVNPSLSEGGCPFTFGEALSVNTPAVMSRIAVTEEVIKDTELQAAMLFDPYDWRSMAERIEWAIQNRAALLSKQQDVFRSIALRTWDDVVADHIDILNHIVAHQVALPVGRQ